MSRKYTLQVKFDHEYDLRRAISALEMLVPVEGENNVMDVKDVVDALTGLHEACFSDKHCSRPAIMPANVDNIHELEAWQDVAANLVRCGMYLQKYIKSEWAQEENSQ